jgi:hypothetical protein
MAVECGFYQRASKLSPDVFFDLLLYCASRTEHISLSFMASFLAANYGIQITKQSLNERFNDKCVSFIQAILVEVLQEKWQNLYNASFLKPFNQVRIQDSTRFNIPSNLAESYRGSGGNRTTSKAAMSIQYEYDLKSGKILTMDITSGVHPDQRYAIEHVQQVSESDLVIRDLGYFSTEVLESISLNKAFFVSRLHSGVSVFTAQDKPLCFKKLHHQMQCSGIWQKELSVTIGLKTKIPVRLLVQSLSDEEYNQRIREKEKENRRKGLGPLNDQTRLRLRFHLIITNASEKDLPAEHVFSLYRLRWQIELMFKIWKSVFKIDRIQKMKKARYICLLLYKMLLIAIYGQITRRVQYALSRQTGKGRQAGKSIPLLSMNKALKTLSALFDEFLEMLRAQKRKAYAIARSIQERLSKNHFLERKKNRSSFAQIIQLFMAEPKDGCD